MRFENRVAVVTGGASGFGACTALRLLEEGARVTIADRDGLSGRRLAAELGLSCHFVCCDITSRADGARVGEETADKFGKIDLLINNAGIGWAGAFSEADDAQIERVLAIDTIGPIRMTQAILPYLKQSAKADPDPGPAIVFTASGLGIKSAPSVSLYAVAKHGVVGLMRSLAAELGPQGIRVNAVCPGIVDTPAVRSMWGEKGTEEALERFRKDRPLNREVTPCDIANAILFLCSNEARMIHSVALVVDGGRLG